MLSILLNPAGQPRQKGRKLFSEETEKPWKKRKSKIIATFLLHLGYGVPFRLVCSDTKRSKEPTEPSLQLTDSPDAKTLQHSSKLSATCQSKVWLRSYTYTLLPRLRITIGCLSCRCNRWIFSFVPGRSRCWHGQPNIMPRFPLPPPPRP
jgi:hypothetical protein